MARCARGRRGGRQTEEVRLFVGVWPDPAVQHQLAEVARPEVPRLRWTTADQWHVTLAFLGQVPAEDAEKLGQAVVQAAAELAAPPLVVAGPATARLGRSILSLPVDGLDEAAWRVRAALGRFGREVEAGDEHGGFRGHLTLARARGRARIPPALVGLPFSARWRVGELHLIASTLTAEGARYETVAIGRITAHPPTIH